MEFCITTMRHYCKHIWVPEQSPASIPTWKWRRKEKAIDWGIPNIQRITWSSTEHPGQLEWAIPCSHSHCAQASCAAERLPMICCFFSSVFSTPTVKKKKSVQGFCQVCKFEQDHLSWLLRVLASNYKVKMRILHTYILTENFSALLAPGF